MVVCLYEWRLNAVFCITSVSFSSGSDALFAYSPRMAPASVLNWPSS